MKWKVSNTLFVLSIVLFALGVLFNWSQVRNSVESSLEKARRVKKEKADARKKQKENKDNGTIEVDELDTEFETIINKQ
tara:strand:- start:2201 stop:2437 length:237 start_codon:yes stop_codon:yes gene_type:complete